MSRESVPTYDPRQLSLVDQTTPYRATISANDPVDLTTAVTADDVEGREPLVTRGFQNVAVVLQGDSADWAADVSVILRDEAGDALAPSDSPLTMTPGIFDNGSGRTRSRLEPFDVSAAKSYEVRISGLVLGAATDIDIFTWAF